MYNFLSLVNDVAASMNEVELSESNFNAATGVYRDFKNAVNSAIRKINQDGVEWPFNHSTVNLVLTPNQTRYAFPADYSSMNWRSFRIRGLAGTYYTQPLAVRNYEEYLAYYSDAEFNPTLHYGTPRHVFKTDGLEFGVYPPPDQAYTLVYEYYKLPGDLVNWNDVPTIPSNFRYVVREGALYYAYMFRGDTEAAMLQDQKFKEGLNVMRRVYVNDWIHVFARQLRG